MTWEWAFIISVLLVCGTIAFCARLLFKDEPADTHDDIESIKVELEQVKADHAAIHKIAEESKKLLSQANLAVGFQPRGPR